MNNIKIFENEKFGEIRTTVIDGLPYFSLKDVCRILDIKNSRNVKARLNLDGVHSMDGVDSIGRKCEITVISESNLYKLIFQSRKEEAEKFTDWVTSEVLPSIRKEGFYFTEKKKFEIISNPDAILEIVNNWKKTKARLMLAETQIERDKPKILFADTMSASSKSILVGELAKLISQEAIRTGKLDRKIGQNNMFAWLRNNGYLCKNGERKNQPRQEYVERGFF